MSRWGREGGGDEVEDGLGRLAGQVGGLIEVLLSHYAVVSKRGSGSGGERRRKRCSSKEVRFAFHENCLRDCGWS